MGAPVTGTHKIVEFAMKFYDALVEQATIESWPSPEQLDTDKLVFRGKVTEVWNSLGASQTYYGRVRRLLLENGCFTLVERGQRNTDTVLVLHRPLPDDVKLPDAPLTSRATFATLSRRIEALEAIQENLGGLDIGQALRGMEIRIAHLESKREIGESNGKST